MALDATVGGTSSNSYLTVSEATTYFRDRINSSTWTDYSNQSALLVTSTLTIDYYMSWYGDKTDEDQALAFPRDGDTIIPTRIKQAVCELALYLIDKGISYDNSDIDMIKVGPLTIDFNEKQNGFLIPDHVARILVDLGEALSITKRRIGQPKLIRV